MSIARLHRRPFGLGRVLTLAALALWLLALLLLVGDRAWAGPLATTSAASVRPLATGMGNWPRAAAASCWHEEWREADGSRINLRVASSPAAREAYRAGGAPGVFGTMPAYVTP